jgi:hypothetical protein
MPRYARMKIVSSIVFAVLAVAAPAAPPENLPPNLRGLPLPKFDRTQTPIFKSVPVVLRITYVSETAYDKGTRWRTVKIREVLKNKTKHLFGESLRVAAVKEKTRGYDGSELGASAYGDHEFIVYLTRFTPPRDDQWLLVTSESIMRE